MKSLIKLMFIIMIIYIVWNVLLKPTANSIQNQEINNEQDINVITIKGDVKKSFTLFNWSIVNVRELKTEKEYYIILADQSSPEIDTPIIVKIRRYDIIKVNDKSFTLYKEI